MFLACLIILEFFRIQYFIKVSYVFEIMCTPLDKNRSWPSDLDDRSSLKDRYLVTFWELEMLEMISPENRAVEENTILKNCSDHFEHCSYHKDSSVEQKYDEETTNKRENNSYHYDKTDPSRLKYKNDVSHYYNDELQRYLCEQDSITPKTDAQNPKAQPSKEHTPNETITMERRIREFSARTQANWDGCSQPLAVTLDSYIGIAERNIQLCRLNVHLKRNNILNLIRKRYIIQKKLKGKISMKEKRIFNVLRCICRKALYASILDLKQYMRLVCIIHPRVFLRDVQATQGSHSKPFDVYDFLNFLLLQKDAEKLLAEIGPEAIDILLKRDKFGTEFDKRTQNQWVKAALHHTRLAKNSEFTCYIPTRDSFGTISETLIEYHTSDVYYRPSPRKCSLYCLYQQDKERYKRCIRIDIGALREEENIRPALLGNTRGIKFQDLVKEYFIFYDKLDVFYEIFPLVMAYSDELSEVQIIMFLICICFRTFYFEYVGSYDFDVFLWLNFFKDGLQEFPFKADDTLLITLWWWIDLDINETCFYNIFYRMLDEIFRTYVKVNSSNPKNVIKYAYSCVSHFLKSWDFFFNSNKYKYIKRIRFSAN